MREEGFYWWINRRRPEDTTVAKWERTSNRRGAWTSAIYLAEHAFPMSDDRVEEHYIIGPKIEPPHEYAP